MLNEDFCDFLEYQITKALEIPGDEQLKGFWCDGVSLPDNENEYSHKYVNDNRHIVMTVFMGKDGQDKYELTMRFGDKSLSRYERGLDIADCVPGAESAGWIDIDVVSRKAVVQLY